MVVAIWLLLVPAGASSGTLRIVSEPGATVLWEGIEIGVTDAAGDLVIYDIPRGEHRLELAKEGYVRLATSVRVDGGRSTVSLRLDAEKRGVDAPPLAGAPPSDEAVAGPLDASPATPAAEAEAPQPAPAAATTIRTAREEEGAVRDQPIRGVDHDRERALPPSAAAAAAVLLLGATFWLHRRRRRATAARRRAEPVEPTEALLGVPRIDGGVPQPLPPKLLLELRRRERDLVPADGDAIIDVAAEEIDPREGDR